MAKVTINKVANLTYDCIEIIGKGKRGGVIDITVHFDHRGKITHAYQHEGTPLSAGGAFMLPESIPSELKVAAWDHYGKDKAA